MFAAGVRTRWFGQPKHRLLQLFKIWYFHRLTNFRVEGAQMSKATLLLTVAFAVMTTSADARPSFMLSDGNRIVTIAPPGAPAAEFLPGTKYLLTNFATKEPKGAYLSAPFGFTISGPSSTFGEAYGLAEQFTLKKSASVTTLAVAVGCVSGDHSFTLT